MSPPVKKETDPIERCIGIFGRWQMWVCFAIFLVKFPVAWHQLNIVFLAPPVNFTCADLEYERCSSNCTQHSFDRSIFSETLITQWDLVCSRSYLANMAQTVTMLGILFGNLIFGYLSDRYGRRLPLIGSVFLQFVTGVLSAFVPWFEVFLLLRFLTAVATGGTMITSFVLVMELVGTRWRTQLGILYQIPFNLGHLSLPLFAYFIRDWKYIQFAISAPSIILLSYWWILPESPRWLLASGQHKKAVAVMERAALFNRLPVAEVRTAVATHTENQDQSKKNNTANIFDLIRTPIMRTYTICVSFNWLVCGLCFYGVAQFIGQLGGNIFVNVALSAVIQVPSTFVSIWSMSHFGRRNSLIYANLVAGVSCISIAFVGTNPTWLRPTFSCIGMFGLAISFPTVYIYSGELFPTVVRNIGVGTASTCARFGSMAAPFIAGLVAIHEWLPPIIFGVVPIAGAVLCLKLPETLNCQLPDTIDEAEQFQIKSESMPTNK